MALHGGPPNPNRVRTHKDTYTPSRVLTPDDVLRGPELDPNDREWHDKTLQWWDRWRRSPLAQLFEETDWDALEKAALLYEELWFATNMSYSERTTRSKEIDRITANYGGTYVDRLKMRVAISSDEIVPASDPVAANNADYRAMLGSAG